MYTAVVVNDVFYFGVVAVESPTETVSAGTVYGCSSLVGSLYFRVRVVTAILRYGLIQLVVRFVNNGFRNYYFLAFLVLVIIIIIIIIIIMERERRRSVTVVVKHAIYISYEKAVVAAAVIEVVYP